MNEGQGKLCNWPQLGLAVPSWVFAHTQLGPARGLALLMHARLHVTSSHPGHKYLAASPHRKHTPMRFTASAAGCTASS